MENKIEQKIETQTNNNGADVKNVKKKDLEKQVSFSWMRVIKNGIKNMKDDIDPVYKGAKMGFYGLHAIPTWVREYKDGRLENDSHGWAGLTGFFVAGTSALGYYVATTEAVKNYGVEGYGVLGIPLLMQGLSYTKEAFRRAKGREHGRVIKARLQQKIDSETQGEYDLSVQDMVKIYEKKDTNVKARRTYERDHEVSEESSKAETKMDAYKELSMLTDNIFKELFAHNHAGSKYELTPDLEVTTVRERYKHRGRDEPSLNNTFAKMIWETVSKNNGSANIEWLGKVTAIYGRDEPGSVHYEVTPCKMWKK
jgi:hypothetical protein